MSEQPIPHLRDFLLAGGVPLGATIDGRVFKPLFLDIGLMNAACGLTAPGSPIENSNAMFEAEDRDGTHHR